MVVFSSQHSHNRTTYQTTGLAHQANDVGTSTHGANGAPITGGMVSFITDGAMTKSVVTFGVQTLGLIQDVLNILPALILVGNHK